MSVYKDKKQGTWYVSFRYVDWTGKKKQKLKRGFRTKKEAREYEAEFKRKASADMDMELGSFVEIYFEDKKNELKQNSIRNKKHMIAAHVIPYRKYKDELTTMEEEQWKLRCDLRNANLDVKEKQMELWKVEQEITDKKAIMETELVEMESKLEELEKKKKVLEDELEQKQLVKKIADMEFEQHCKGNEERLDRLQKEVLVAKQLYDEYVKLPISGRHYQSMEDMVELKQRVNELEEENRELRGLLRKAYDFMKQFVVNGMTLLDKFLETVGRRTQNVNVFGNKKR